MSHTAYEEERDDTLLVPDIEATAERNPDGVHTNMLRDGIRVYTRTSRRPELSNNGGDYDFYTDYIVNSDGRVIAVEDWSADWEYTDYRSSTIYVYGKHTVDELHAIAQRLCAKEPKLPTRSISRLAR